MDIERISRRVYAVLNHNSTSNAGIILTTDGPILVDTLNTPHAGRELADRCLGVASAAPIMIVNTHIHFDHIFGNQAFSAPVVAHVSLAASLKERLATDFSPEQLAQHLAQYPEDAWMRDELKVVYPHIGFVDRLVLDFGGPQVLLRHLGGHTPCLVVVHVPEEGVVFASDLLFIGRTPFMRWADTLAWVAALEQVEQMEAGVVVPGHGEPVALSEVGRFRCWLEDLYGRIAGLVEEGYPKEALGRANLPRWVDDRPTLHLSNIEWIYEQVRRTV